MTMGKSEYTDIHYLPGEKAQPQIKIDAEALLDLLLRAELMMTKVDRIRYATPAIVMLQDVIKEIVLTYDFDDDREIHLKRMCANIAVFISISQAPHELRCYPRHGGAGKSAMVTLLPLQ